MLTRSKQRLLENNENINNENRLNTLKRKRSTKTKKHIEKENVFPTTIRYSLRSQSKLKDNTLALKSKNENIINRERGILKDKLLKNAIVNNVVKASLKTNVFKKNDTTNKTVKKPLKEKKAIKNNNKNTNTNTDIINNNKKLDKKEENKDSKIVVLIEGNRLKDNIINKIQNEDEKKDTATTTSIEPKAKKIKTNEKEDKKVSLKKESVENKKSNVAKTELKKSNEKTTREKTDQKSEQIIKSSIVKKKDNNTISKEKKKITFDDNVQHIENSLVINDTASTIDTNYTDNIRIDETNSKILKIDDSLSPIKKENNQLIVPFIRMDSDSSSFISNSSSNGTMEYDNINNKLEKKSSGLSDKSLELLTDFTKNGGKVHLSDLLESLSGKGHLVKSSTPNSFNKTLLFLEESPINYTRILNEEMNFNTPQNRSVNYPEKEVSNLSSQNTSFQDSNSLSNFINISPISNSILRPSDSDFEPIHSSGIMDESDLFNTDDKSSLYSMNELDEKIRKLLSDKDNQKKAEIPAYRYQRSSIPSYSRLGMDAPVVEEITYDQPENISYLIQSQGSSSDDPFGFSKAEKIYKVKQQQLKNNEPHTPISSHKQYYTLKKESHSLDSANEILLQEHQQILEAKKKNRNRKKINIEEMEQLNSDDIEELKHAKDQQMKYFKEIDDYVLNETVL